MGLPETAVDDELRGCADELRRRLGVESTHMAYPYGAVDPVVSARAAAHFQYGHTTFFDVLTTGADRMLCPRLDMYYFGAPGALDTWGRPAFRRRAAWIRARRSIRRRITGDWGS